jgi:chemotaxis protein methyltransferase CheR
MPPSASPAEVRELARYLNEASGIELDESKGYLFESRFAKLAEGYGCQTLGCLLERARRDPTGKLRGALVDAVSTNETSFFRESAQFDLLAHEVVPNHFEQQRTKRLRIWCAAASTGQEGYSIAIVLKEMLGSLLSYGIQILGTDISGAVLEKASKGVYSSLEVERGLSPERLGRYFTKRSGGYVISDELRSLVTYQRLNLLESQPSLGVFDIILCRNVAIYFSPVNRSRLFNNLAQNLRRGGVLLLSRTETMSPQNLQYSRKEYRGLTYYERG